LLQARVIPPLLGTEGDPVKVWSIGGTSDAVAVTVAFAEAEGAPSGRLRTFASGTSTSRTSGSATSVHWGDVSLRTSEIDRLAPANRKAWFQRRRHCWIPRATIAERIVLGPPTQLVDLVTIRPNTRFDPRIRDQLRDGGHLLIVDGSPWTELPSGRAEDSCAERPGWLRPVEGERRLFRKVGAARSTASRLRGADDRRSEGPTLATRLRQEELVLAHVELARSLARRFGHRGQPIEDLEQVAMLALVGAARRYDPQRGTAFAGYAAASVLGELKRYFRDRTWSMRVPRSLQERHMVVASAREELGHRLGESPTVLQVAEHVGISEEEVLEAIEAGSSYRAESLDVGPLDDDRARDIPMVDGSLDLVLDRQRLRAALPRLDHRELVILKGIYLDG
jgi:RNA polymerase sigma factor (sigma-70 family)